MKKLMIFLTISLMSTICFADEYYLGSWISNKSDQWGTYWHAPHQDKLTGLIDLRSIPQQSLEGGTPQGFGIFSFSEAVSDINLTYIGNEKTEISKKQKENFEKRIGYSIKSIKIVDLIYEIITEKGDPTGQASFRPFASSNLKIKVGAAEKQVKIIPFISKEWPLMLARIQEDYRHLLKIEKYQKIAKWLDALEQEYKVPYEIFIPDDAIKIVSLPHQTTVTEDFNCSDNDSLNCDLSWTELGGDIDIVSNQAKTTTINGRPLAREDSALASDKHYSQVQAVDRARNAAAGAFVEWHVMCRVTDLNNFYIFTLSDVAGTDQINLFKRVGGTFTQLGAAKNQTISVPHTIKIYYDGINVMAEVDGVIKYIQVDSAVPSAFTAGIGGNISNHASQYIIEDNFEASDLAFTDIILNDSRWSNTLFQ